MKRYTKKRKEEVRNPFKTQIGLTSNGVLVDGLDIRKEWDSTV